MNNINNSNPEEFFSEFSNAHVTRCRSIEANEIEQNIISRTDSDENLKIYGSQKRTSCNADHLEFVNKNINEVVKIINSDLSNKKNIRKMSDPLKKKFKKKNDCKLVKDGCEDIFSGITKLFKGFKQICN
eukprot:Mrub_13351.p1 GENE.Mrub_13351~~Mrub_13351.p1  ORF type:complete len:130 (-),score=20.16 Mrub_13351:128-517(-)